ncbi:MAG: CHAD domain-containing protein [Dehalococcoidia bacterium]
MEIEIKLRLLERATADDLAAIDFAPYVRAEPERHDLQDWLFDTADGVLAARRQALRVRRDGGRLLVTYKGPPEGSGHLHQREEIEVLVEHEPAESGDWPPAIREAIGEIDPMALTIIVGVTNHRIAWRLYRDGAPVAELVLDDGQVAVGAEREAFHEIEVELLPGGTTDDLTVIEQRLAERLKVVPENRSKLERALTLRRRLTIPGGAALPSTGSRSLRKNLDRLRAAEGVALEGIDPDGVHDLRVALRRLRTALQIMAGAGVAPKRLGTLRRRLRALARSAASVRDADVQLAAMDGLNDVPEGLVAAVERQRAEGRDRLIAALQQAKTARALVRLDDEIVRLRRHGEASPPANGARWLTRHFAGSRLWDRYEAVAAYEGALGEPDGETLHRLRIAIKRLRYAIEFFEEALGPEAKGIRTLLAELQDLLGAHHDATVAIDLAHSLEGADPAAVDRFVIGRQEFCRELVQQVQSRWHQLGGPTFRELLGRCLAPSSSERQD